MGLKPKGLKTMGLRPIGLTQMWLKLQGLAQGGSADLWQEWWEGMILSGSGWGRFCTDVTESRPRNSSLTYNRSAVIYPFVNWTDLTCSSGFGKMIYFCESGVIIKIQIKNMKEDDSLRVSIAKFAMQIFSNFWRLFFNGTENNRFP